MKKIILFISIFFISMFSFNINIYALCSDKDLNEWAVDTNVKFIYFDKYLVDEETGKEIHELGFSYSYILSLNNMRDDIVMKATTDSGRKLDGIYVPGHKVYGLVDYTPKYGANYKITIYGGENSACPNEVLKVLNYEVEQFNFYHKTEACEKYPDAEICQMYKNTSDMSYDEFEEEIEEYEKEVIKKNDKTFFDKLMIFMANYGVFILIPMFVIMFIYMIKISKLKEKERKK